MRQRILVLLVLGVLLPALYGQTTFQDSQGRGSIVLNYQAGFGQLNLTDTSVKIGYFSWNTGFPIRFGFEISGKAADGLVSLFEKKTVAPEAELRLSIGYHELWGKKGRFIADDWLVCQLGYRRGVYDLFYPEREYEAQIAEQTFDGFRAALIYNALIAVERGNLLVGISLGYEKRNNYDDLEKVEVTDFSVIHQEGGFLRGTNKTRELRRGDYQESNYLLVDIDILWQPPWNPNFLGKALAFNLFARCDLGADKTVFRPGLAALLTSGKGAGPLKILGGISFELQGGEPVVGLFAGIHF